MRLEHYNEVELKRKVLEIFSRHLDLNKYRVFFFGSRVAGGGDERSDVDVGIEGPAPTPAGALSEIQAELEELPTLYKVEVVDLYRTSERFKKVAKQKIELLNPVNV